MTITAQTDARTDVRENSIVSRMLPAALLAPSAHNTQPWEFKTKDTALDIYIDGSRHLAVSDPTKRQLYMSIGCAITNALIIAQKWGYEPQVVYFPEGQDEISMPVTRITCSLRRQSPPQGNTIAALADTIERRHTDRSFYDAKPLTEGERAQLPAKDNLGVLFIEDRPRIAALAQLTEEGTINTLSRPDFKEELSHWVRNSWTRKVDGMPGYAMGMPAPLSLLAPMMVRVAPIHKQEGPKTRKQLESASAVAVLVTPHDTPQDWMNAGQLLERIWLEAVAAGLAAAPLAAAVEAGEDVRIRLAKKLNTAQKPQGILRIGHSTEKNLRATPRRSLEDCVRA